MNAGDKAFRPDSFISICNNPHAKQQQYPAGKIIPCFATTE
jgi:hypothetical protein